MPMIRTDGKKTIDDSYLRTGGTAQNKRGRKKKKEEEEEEPTEEEITVDEPLDEEIIEEDPEGPTVDDIVVPEAPPKWCTRDEKDLMKENKTPLIEYVKENSKIDIPDDATKAEIIKIIQDNSL